MTCRIVSTSSLLSLPSVVHVSLYWRSIQVEKKTTVLNPDLLVSLITGNMCSQGAKGGQTHNISRFTSCSYSIPCHTCTNLLSPHGTLSQILTIGHTSLHLVTPPHTSDNPHNFSRLRTCFKPISKQSTAQDRYEEIKTQTRHQQTVQCNLKHVQDSWRV